MNLNRKNFSYLAFYDADITFGLIHISSKKLQGLASESLGSVIHDTFGLFCKFGQCTRNWHPPCN